MRRPARVPRWGPLVLGLGTLAVACQTSRKPAETPVERAAATSEARGQEAFLAYCAMCHGEAGVGNGPLASQLTEQGVAVPARLDDRARLTEMGREGMIRVITRGGAHTGRSNLMPPWGERLSSEVIGEIADFVLTLPDRSLGTPTTTIAKYLEAPPGTPAEGRRLFVYYCSACHGPQGRGDGIYADSLRVRHNVRPRDLTDSAYFAPKTDQTLYATIALGGSHAGKSVFMPAWNVSLSPGQIKDLVSYVRAVSRTAAQP